MRVSCWAGPDLQGRLSVPVVDVPIIADANGTYEEWFPMDLRFDPLDEYFPKDEPELLLRFRRRECDAEGNAIEPHVIVDLLVSS